MYDDFLKSHRLLGKIETKLCNTSPVLKYYYCILCCFRLFFPRRRHVQPHPIRPRATSHSAPSLTGYPEYVQYCNVRTTRIISYIIYLRMYRCINSGGEHPTSVHILHLYIPTLDGRTAGSAQ